MINFFEFLQKLPSDLESSRRIDETSQEMQQRLAALKGKLKPATVTPTTPAAPAAPAAAAPTPTEAPPAAAAPAFKRKEVPNDVVAKVNRTGDINDPNSDEFQKRQARQGVKPSSSKAMAQHDPKLHAQTEKLMNFNNFLADPSYKGLTAMAVADLAETDPFFKSIDVPETGRFRLSANSPVGYIQTPHGNKIEMTAPDIVAPTAKIMDLIDKVQSYVAGEKSGAIGKNASLRQALVRPFGQKKGMKPIILRALKFERLMAHPKIIMRLNSIADQAERFAAIAGEGSPVDYEALKYLIQTAKENGFGNFVQTTGEVNDPQTLVKFVPTNVAGQVEDDSDDPYTTHKTVGSPLDRARAAFQKLRGESRFNTGLKWLS